MSPCLSKRTAGFLTETRGSSSSSSSSSVRAGRGAHSEAPLRSNSSPLRAAGAEDQEGMHQLAEREPDHQCLGRQDVHAEQSLVRRAAGMGVGQHAGRERRRRQQPAEVVVEVRDQPLHGVREPVDQHCHQRRERDGAQERDDPGGQRGPWESEDIAEVETEQAREHVVEEQDVGHEEQQCGEEPEVECVAHDLAERRAFRNSLRGHDRSAISLSPFQVAGCVAPTDPSRAQQGHADQAPQHADDEDDTAQVSAGPRANSRSEVDS